AHLRPDARRDGLDARAVARDDLLHALVLLRGEVEGVVEVLDDAVEVRRPRRAMPMHPGAVAGDAEDNAGDEGTDDEQRRDDAGTSRHCTSLRPPRSRRSSRRGNRASPGRGSPRSKPCSPPPRPPAPPATPPGDGTTPPE